MNTKYLQLLFTLLIFLPLRSDAQKAGQIVDNFLILQQLPDTLQDHLKYLGGKKKQIHYLLGEIANLRFKDPELCLGMTQYIIQLPKVKKASLEYGQALFWKADIYSSLYRESNVNQIILEWVKACSQIFKMQESTFWLARAHYLHSYIYYNLYNYELSLEYLNMAKQLASDIRIENDEYWVLLGDIARIKGNISYTTLDETIRTDSAQINYDLSTEYYTRARDTFNLARLEENTAIIYSDERSETHYQNAFQLYQRVGSKKYLANCYLEYGAYCLKMYKEKDEIIWYNRGVAYLEKGLSTSPSEKCAFLQRIGALYHTRAYQDKYFRNKDVDTLLDSAYQFYNQSMETTIKEGSQKCLRELQRSIQHLCYMVELSTCSELYERVIITYDSLLANTIVIMKKAKDENERLQKEIADQKMRRRSLLWLTGFFFLLVVLLIIFYVIKARMFRKTLSSRLAALRAQMNPHFISNSLNAIDSLVNQGRNEEASDYIIDFSRLCRKVLDNSKDQFVSLENELETLEYFISLEKLRLGEMMICNIKVDQTIDISKVYVPPMLLQPFVENAIWHGIQKKQSKGSLSIAITKKPDDFLEFTVTDDGVGRQKARELQEKSILEQQSWGINITEERINALKKVKGSEMEVIDLYDQNGQPAGTKVFILLPLINKPAIHPN